MLAFADVVHFLAHELPGLRRRSLPLTLVLPRSLDGIFIGHPEPPWGGLQFDLRINGKSRRTLEAAGSFAEKVAPR